MLDTAPQKPKASDTERRAYDRGEADSHYHRRPSPNYWLGNTSLDGVVTKECMSREEIRAYWRGYERNEQMGDHKQW